MSHTLKMYSFVPLESPNFFRKDNKLKREVNNQSTIAFESNDFSLIGKLNTNPQKIANYSLLSASLSFTHKNLDDVGSQGVFYAGDVSYSLSKVFIFATIWKACNKEENKVIIYFADQAQISIFIEKYFTVDGKIDSKGSLMFSIS